MGEHYNEVSDDGLINYLYAYTGYGSTDLKKGYGKYYTPEEDLKRVAKEDTIKEALMNIKKVRESVDKDIKDMSEEGLKVYRIMKEGEVIGLNKAKEVLEKLLESTTL